MTKKTSAHTVPLKGFPKTQPFTTIEDVETYFAGDTLTCLYCGHEYTALHKHLRLTHDTDPDTYREEFGIPWRKGLISESHRQKQAAIMNKQRADGILPQAPPPEHVKRIQDAAKTRRQRTSATKDAQRRHGLKMHGRTERWGPKDFEEFLKRIKSGRTITEVGRDRDMPCREVFDGYKKANSDFNAAFESAWNALPFDVQIRGQRTGKRFKATVVKLRKQGKTWPQIGRIMGIKEGTARNTWHRLKKKGLIEN